MVEIGLEDHVGVRLQEFEKASVGNPALLVQAGHDAVVHESRGALIHDLGLPLRIKILRQVSRDAQQLPLPGLQARCGLLEKIEQVLLRQAERARRRSLVSVAAVLIGPVGTVRQRSLKARSSYEWRSPARRSSARRSRDFLPG